MFTLITIRAGMPDKTSVRSARKLWTGRKRAETPSARVKEFIRRQTPGTS